MRNDTRILPENVRAVALHWSTHNRPGYAGTLHYAWSPVSGPPVVPWGLLYQFLENGLLRKLQAACSTNLAGLAWGLRDNHSYTHPELRGGDGVGVTDRVQGEWFPSVVSICFAKRSAVLKPWTSGRLFLPCVCSGHMVGPAGSHVNVAHPALEAVRAAMLERLEVREPPEVEQYFPSGDFFPVIWRPKTQSFLEIKAVTINPRLAVVRRRRWIVGFR